MKPCFKRYGSSLALGLAALYAILFAYLYVDYRRNAGTFLADLGLNLIALPYVVVGRALSGDGTFELHGFEPVGVVLGAAFCTLFVYAIGLGIDRTARWIVRVTRRRR